MSDSLARIPIRIRVEERGEARGELNRLTAPLTVAEILKRLPIKARVIPSMEGISILLDIRRGTEKPVTEVEAGTIAYWPRQDALCIYPKETKTYNPVNKLGVIYEGLEIFSGVRSGTRIVVEKIRDTQPE